MPPEIKPKTPLSLEIHNRMRAKGLSAHQLADATEVVYETIRGIVAGDRPPGKLLFREICRVIDLDFVTANKMLTAEQMKRKFGCVATPPGGRNPELQPIEERWPFLLPEEKEHIIWLVGHLTGQRGRKHEDPVSPQRIAPHRVRTP
jgi:hypothetical protein